MKSLSKSIKTAFVFIALLFAGVLFAISPVSHSINLQAIGAETTTTSGTNVLKISHVPQSKVDLSKGQTLEIPLLTSQTNYTIRVIDKSGQYHDCKVNSSSGVSITNTEYFKLSDDNTYITVNSNASNSYKILYIYKDASNNKVYYSNTYNVEVIGQNYTLDYRVVNYNAEGTTIESITNNEYLLPTQQATGTSATITKVHSHPIYEDEDEELDLSNWKEIKPYVTFNGTHYEIDQEVTINDKTFTLIKANTDGTYTINFAVAGNYAIEYTDENANNTVTETKEITITDNFVKPSTADISITGVTLPTGTELGDKDVTLPKPVLAYPSSYGNYNAGYTINYIEIKQTYGNIVLRLDRNQTKFDFTTDYFNEKLGTNYTYEDLAGRYSVSYNMTDVYGNIVEIKNADWKTISISSKPEIYMTYDYDNLFTTDTEDANKVIFPKIELEDLDTTVTSEIKKEYSYTNLIFPAVYAQDKISNYDNLLVTRYLRDSSGNIYYLDNVRVDTTNWQYVKVTETDSYNYNYALQGEGGYEFSENNLEAYYKQLAKSVRFELWDYDKEGESADNHTSMLNKDYSLVYRVYVKNATPGTTSTGTSAHRYDYVYESTGSYYSFKITNSSSVVDPDANNLTVKIDDSISNGQQVKQDDELNIKLTATDSNDVRLNNALYYYTSYTGSKEDVYADIKAVLTQELLTTYGIGSTSVLKSKTLIEAMQNKGYTNFGLVKANSSNEYVLTLDEEFITGADKLNNAKTIKLVGATLNDYGTVAVSGTKLLNIADTTETTAPKISVAYDASSTYNKTWWDNGEMVVGQNVKVELPDVEFEDDVDKILSLSVAYYVVPTKEATDDISSHNYYNNPYKYPSNYYFDGNTIRGGTITTNAVGTYYIVYTAIDDAGNTTLAHFSFVVESTTEPTLKVTPTGGNFTGSGTRLTCESGSSIGFETEVIDPSTGDAVTDATITAVVTSDGLSWTKDGSKENAYIFNDAGDYTVTITAKTAKHTVTRTYTVNVTEPKLAWDNEDTFSYKQYVDENTDVYLNPLTASHGSYNVVVSVKYIDSEGNTHDAEYVGNQWKITTGKKGRYTITYTAESTAPSDNVITKTFSMQVGDNKGPEITVNNSGVLTQDITHTSNDITYTIKLNTSRKVMIIEVKNGDEVVYTWTSYDNWNNLDHNNMIITEYDGQGISDRDFDWSGLKVTLANSNGDLTATETEETIDGRTYNVYTYTLTSKDDYTLSLSIEDAANNVSQPKTFNFKLVGTAEPKGINDNVVGIVLVVVSAVILIGVILFFVFTGRRGGGKAISTSKKEEENNTKTKKNSKKTDDAVEGEVE